jgi:hypothetical protein
MQAAFSDVYVRTQYNLSIDYDAPLVPAPTIEEEAWLQAMLQ